MGALVPLAVLSALVVVRVAQDERAAVEQRLAEASRDLADALDREVAAGFRTLAALGGSERLERGDIAGFADEAARVEATQPRWLAVLLFTPEGLRVVDTRTVGDVAPEPTLDPESLRQAIESGRPTVSSLLRSGGGGPWAFALRMPVISGGRARWVLTAVIEADAIGEMVAVRPGADGEWTRTVVDPASLVAMFTIVVATLSVRFGDNTLKEMNDFKLVLEKDQLAGLPAQEIAAGEGERVHGGEGFNR